MRERHRERRLRLLKAIDSFRERRERVFAALRSRLEEDLVDEPTSLYDDDEAVASTDSYNTSVVTKEADRTAKLEEPSSRVLYSVFEELDNADFYADDYPKTSVVNDMLEDRGYGRLDKETIDDACQQWLRTQESGATKAAGKKSAKKRAAKKPATKK